MSETKALRPVAEIQRELNNMLARAGGVQFNVTLQQRDLAKLNAEIEALNIEWSMAKSDEAKAAAAPPVENTPPASEESNVIKMKEEG